MDILVLALLIAACGVMLAIGCAARARVKNHAEFEHMHEWFFKAANKLVEDPRTPEFILSYVEGMAHYIMNGSVAQHVVWRIVSGEVRKEYHNPPPQMLAFRNAVQALPPDLLQWLAGAMVSFAFAVSLRSVLFGWFMRRTILSQVKASPDPVKLRDSATIVTVTPVLSDIDPAHCAAAA